MRAELERQLEDMQKYGITEESNSVWNSPVVLIKPEFRRRRHHTCWGKSHRTWLLNKFISFLAVLSWKSDKN